MQESFYKKVEKLKEKICNCKNIREMRRVVKSSGLDMNVSYTSWDVLNIEESLNSGHLSGHFKARVVANISDGEKTTNNRFNHGVEWLCEEAFLTKEEMEERRFIAIMSSLQHLDLEEEYNG